MKEPTFTERQSYSLHLGYTTEFRKILLKMDVCRCVFVSEDGKRLSFGFDCSGDKKYIVVLLSVLIIKTDKGVHVKCL